MCVMKEGEVSRSDRRWGHCVVMMIRMGMMMSMMMPMTIL